MLHNIDEKAKLYTLEHTHGKDTYYSSLGFEYAYGESCKVWAWLVSEKAQGEILEPSRDRIGSVEGYKEYSNLMEAGRAYEAIRHDAEIEDAAVDLFAGYHLWAVVSLNTKPLYDLLIKRGLLHLDKNDVIRRA